MGTARVSLSLAHTSSLSLSLAHTYSRSLLQPLSLSLSHIRCISHPTPSFLPLAQTLSSFTYLRLGGKERVVGTARVSLSLCLAHTLSLSLTHPLSLYIAHTHTHSHFEEVFLETQFVPALGGQGARCGGSARGSGTACFRVSHFAFRDSGFGFRISGFRFRVPGFGFRVWRCESTFDEHTVFSWDLR